MSKIICLDAGHGGTDSGAVNGARYEKNDTLRLCQILKQELERCGFKVVMTRESEQTVPLNDRPKIANNAKADYFLSIHRNSFSATSTGIEGWIYSKADADTTNKATAIYNYVMQVANVSLRGIKKGYTGNSANDYAVNKYSNMPSMLLELLFISNSSDNEIFDRYINEYAVAICKGFCDMFSVSYVPKSSDIYRVQVGAFKEKANADKLLDELKGKGFNGFISK